MSLSDLYGFLSGNLNENFHPCFNGWVFQTCILISFVFPCIFLISILVLMDESFRLQKNAQEIQEDFNFHPCFNGWVFQTIIASYPSFPWWSCFHPCFNGWVFQTLLLRRLLRIFCCFHPCFNGWVFQTHVARQLLQWARFPSLF